MRVDATLADSQPYYGTDFISIVDFYMLSYRERQASGRICSSHGRICQTEVMTTTQLSCWVPLQIAPNCMSMRGMHVCTFTNRAFICTPMVKDCGGPWDTKCSHTCTWLGLHVEQFCLPSYTLQGIQCSEMTLKTDLPIIIC